MANIQTSMLNLFNGHRPTSISESRQLKTFMLECATDMDYNVSKLKYERMARHLQEKAAGRLKCLILTTAKTLADVQRANDAGYVEFHL